MSLHQLAPEQVRPLVGAFLALDLRAHDLKRPKIVSAFLQSIDGRIALDGKVPAATANERDWRLFQELAAQADVVLMASRFVRETDEGTAQTPPPVDAERFPDLIAWRRARGLALQPALWILASGRRALPQEPLKRWAKERTVCVLAPEPIELPDGVAWMRWQQPKALGELLDAQGARLVLFAAGGVLHRLMLAAGLIDECFLTLRLRILAGESMRTLAEGKELTPPADFSLANVWLDDGIAPPQLFLRLVQAKG